jgi:hypothetical protein
MIPTVQFDPATLAIWTTTSALLEPANSLAAEAIAAAMSGDNPADKLSEIPNDDPLRLRLLWLASAVWHEKRHFFDTCLTNYGARRFRDLFTLAGNFLPLAAEASNQGQPVWFPVEVYGCAVRRRVLGIPEPAENILAIARLARDLKGLNSQFDAPARQGASVFHVGAEAQMEGLAQVTQSHSIEHRFGLEDLVGVTAEYVHRLPREGPYRAIEAVSGGLGCVFETEGGNVAINSSLASALFITALCSPFYGSGPQPPRELVAPWPRLARLIEALGPRPGRFQMSDEEAFAVVDRAAKTIWGRTALEEIAADIDASEARVAKISWLPESLANVFADFIALRRRLLKATEEKGAASLLPRQFPILWLDHLQPWHVVATPGGDFSTEGAPVCFGMKLNVPKGFEHIVPPQVTWGRLHESTSKAGESCFAVRDHAAWLEMLERNGPAAQLMLNGRRHRRMVPPELDRPVTDLKDLDIPVRFDPQFEWPAQRSSKSCVEEAIELAKFSGRKEYVCDITGERVSPENAAVLTGLEVRQSSLVERFRQSGIIAEIQLITNWSDWIVRRDLVPS